MSAVQPRLQFNHTYMEAVRVGTDGCDLPVPIMALNSLRVPVRHVFTGNNNMLAAKVVQAHFPAEFVHIGDRRQAIIPDMDVYVARLACPTLDVGLADECTDMLSEPVSVIAGKLPRLFLLESTQCLVEHNGRRTLHAMLHRLGSIQGPQGCAYTVRWRILNSHDFGIPQQRLRTYIAGVLNHARMPSQVFNWPQPMAATDIADFLDPA